MTSGRERGEYARQTWGQKVKAPSDAVPFDDRTVETGEVRRAAGLVSEALGIMERELATLSDQGTREAVTALRKAVKATADRAGVLERLVGVKEERR